MGCSRSSRWARLAAAWCSRSAPATQGDVTAAMHVEAPSSARDDVFARWIRELGLPVRDEVTELELSRFVVGGQTACLLIESPEAIDFTAEVTATLERQMTTTSP